MPVVGHAFVGAATALATAGSGSGRSPSARALWVPTLVGLAYLPDIPGAITPGAWFGEARALGHSALLVALAGAPLGFALARWARTRVSLGIAIVVFSLLVHDVLDLLQNTDRVPLWPFSDRPLGLGLAVLPHGAWSEALVFGAGFAVFGLGYVLARRGSRAPSLPPLDRRWRLARLIGTAAVVLAAVSTQLARGVREEEYRVSQAILREGRYAEALLLLDRAESWPSLAPPGRIDYLRGEAYAGMGDFARAEEHYLKSYRANPGYCWLLVDLAVFYADSPRSFADRKRLVEPLVRRLHDEFGGVVELQPSLARIERKLAGPPDDLAEETEPK